MACRQNLTSARNIYLRARAKRPGASWAGHCKDKREKRWLVDSSVYENIVFQFILGHLLNHYPRLTPVCDQNAAAATFAEDLLGVQP